MKTGDPVVPRKVETILSYQLKPPRGYWDLRDYVFSDEEHARDWMAQTFTKVHRAVAVIIRRRRCNCACGERGHFKDTIVRDKSRPDLLTPASVDVLTRGEG